MGIFQIEVESLTWIDGSADDPQDLCLHGHVRVQIGQRVLEDDATVSATALYLLKTLTEDKRMEPHSIQMLPCCGFFMIANKERTEVEIIGCDNGTDWSVIHQDGKIRLILPTGRRKRWKWRSTGSRYTVSPIPSKRFTANAPPKNCLRIPLTATATKHSGRNGIEGEIRFQKTTDDETTTIRSVLS